MGRAIFVVICALIFTLTPINTSVNMESKTAEWNMFTTQYRYLINDGKYELAEKMLQNRLPEMEQYVETLSVRQKENWESLVKPLKDGQVQTSPSDVEKFMTYVKAISSDKPSQYVNEVLQDFRGDIQENPFQTGQILSEWERIVPILSLRYKSDEINLLSSAVSNLAFQDSYNARRDVVQQLDKLLSEDSSLVQDAFLWTAVIIGGTIMLTLIYVGLRKFQAERKEEKPRGRENS